MLTSIFLSLLIGAILVEGTIALISYLTAGKEGFIKAFRLLNAGLLVMVLWLAGATLMAYIFIFVI